METAYLYIRVSTDEQKRKGYSLPEQEDRLLKYCDYNSIKVKGIYREDFSAKNFNRPEWKKLIATVKKKPANEEINILFVKWDRFSRSIQYAYEMIGLLRKHNTIAMAIDQPIDLNIPESAVMLAVYLSVPEAENTRRALNTTNGIRRAKQMGRYPNKAPLGYANLTGLDGKKYIAPKQPEAGIIKWIFQQLAKNSYKIEEIRKMACVKGLRCSRSYFVRLIRNPVYCGLVRLLLNDNELQMIRGVHDALISETLFYEVQEIINTKRKIDCKTNELQETFFLKGYLTCPACNRKLRGSFSRGSTKRYPYYHCIGKCKTRISATLLNNCYQEKLEQLFLSNKITELFNYILEDINIGTLKTECLHEKKTVFRQLEEQKSLLSKARKLFVEDVLKFDDFSELKKECIVKCKCLKKELNDIVDKLRRYDEQSQLKDMTLVSFFQRNTNLDIEDKKHLLTFISPVNINFKTGDLSLGLNKALSKILLLKN